MKITIDTKTNEVKIGGKLYNEADSLMKSLVETQMRKFLIENTELTSYEKDAMWMSYRYCVGRHSITSSMHAGAIWENCKGRMSKERQLFTAFDINREIENCLNFKKPYFHFPLTSLNRIYTPAVDIVLQFMEDYNIKSKEDFLKYRDINVILTNNEIGYKLETVTWEEWLRPRVLKIMQDFYNNDCMSEDFAWDLFKKWQNGNKELKASLDYKLVPLTQDIPNPENYYFTDLEDLFVWNDLVHCFDYEHFHKSILIDGTECIWFWSWTDNVEEREPGKFYKAFGYHKVRRPLDKWHGSYSCYIPDESIKEDIY